MSKDREIFRRLDVLTGQVVRLGTRFEDFSGGPQPIDGLSKGSLLSRVSKLEERANRLDGSVDDAFDRMDERVRALETPPKDLSDPYPKDGPNVGHQDKHDALLQRLRELERVPGADKKIRLLEVRLTALSETVAKNRKHYDALTEQVTDNAKQADREMCMTSGSLSVTPDGCQLFVERRVEQRRADSDDRRNFSTRKCRHGGESLGRRIQDRRQP